MLKGRASQAGYALFLFNLLPAYRALEIGLERHARLVELAMPALYRSAAIESDLKALGYSEHAAPAVLAAGTAYGTLVAEADPARILAHAYVRFLGDLNGGQILARLLARAPGLGREALAFYRFPGIIDLDAFRDGYRSAIDRVALSAAEEDAALEEACAAFVQNIHLSEQVAAAEV